MARPALARHARAGMGSQDGVLGDPVTVRGKGAGGRVCGRHDVKEAKEVGLLHALFFLVGMRRVRWDGTMGVRGEGKAGLVWLGLVGTRSEGEGTDYRRDRQVEHRSR